MDDHGKPAGWRRRYSNLDQLTYSPLSPRWIESCASRLSSRIGTCLAYLLRALAVVCTIFLLRRDPWSPSSSCTSRRYFVKEVNRSANILHTFRFPLIQLQDGRWLKWLSTSSAAQSTFTVISFYMLHVTRFLCFPFFLIDIFPMWPVWHFPCNTVMCMVWCCLPHLVDPTAALLRCESNPRWSSVSIGCSLLFPHSLVCIIPIVNVYIRFNHIVHVREE